MTLLKWGTFAVLALAAIGLVYSVPSRVYAPALALVHGDTPVSVLFVGDIMLDRNVARTIDAEGPQALFASTSALLANADLRVANLEGTITDNPSIAQVNNKILHFTFDPAQARAVLEPLHFDAFSQANNHAYDFGADGYEQTRQNIAAMGVAEFGHPYNVAADLETKLMAKGKTICLIGYHSLFDPATSTVVEAIESGKPDCWRTVVFAHWGVEYQTHSTPAQEAEAHSFIDAGADLVIGAHPHVVEERETYKGKAIFYSLGNFMFDQNFSFDTTHGLAVRADFYDGKTIFTLIPTTIKEQHAAIAEGAEKDPILGRLGGLAEFTLP